MSLRLGHESRTVSPAVPSDITPFFLFLRSLVAWDSLLFAAICLADMLTTLYWVHLGKASEANPLLAACLARGVIPFCCAKILSFLPMLLIAAYYRGEYPKFVPAALRVGMIGYVIAYAVGVGSQLLVR